MGFVSSVPVTKPLSKLAPCEEPPAVNGVFFLSQSMLQTLRNNPITELKLVCDKQESLSSLMQSIFLRVLFRDEFKCCI